jgi:LuxR family transcriptional regulator of spore coat protein
MNCQGDDLMNNINDFLIDCGKSDSPRELSVKIIECMEKIIPYDQARIYFLDQKNVIIGEILLGVDKRWMNAYKDYFSQILDGRYSVTKMLSKNSFCSVKNIDYTVCLNDEFVRDYIRPQRILNNISFALRDQHGIIRKLLMFDRTGKVGYSKQDLTIFAKIMPLLQNLHKNYYIQPKSEDEFSFNGEKPTSILTKRESEIAMMIKDGFTPERIAQALFMSCATVYKHIEHIHKKLHVSNRQELILKLLHMSLFEIQAANS